VIGSKFPVTALTLEANLLLAGEGPFLRIYDKNTSNCLYWIRVLNNETIHGFLRLKSSSRTANDRIIYNFVIWAGRRIQLLSIEKTEIDVDSEQFGILVALGCRIEAPDWILDASECAGQVFALTAHNQLLSIDTQHCIARVVSSGPQVMLFCAHMTVLEKRTILIASGTVFGDVLIWTCVVSDELYSTQNRLHYKFSGHEGSIFGVRISEPIYHSDDDGQPLRIVSSCSDDRTIRVWDISDLTPTIDLSKNNETGFRDSNERDPCLASVMGHLSRIWHLRYIYSPHFKHWFTHEHKSQPSIVRIISAGEDATCQIWEFVQKIREPDVAQVEYDLVHRRTMECHEGKNIWAVEVLSDSNTSPVYRVFTGGADGAIKSFEDSTELGNAHVQSTSILELYQNSEYSEVSLIEQNHIPEDNCVPHQPKGRRLHIRHITLLKDNNLLVLTSDGQALINDSVQEGHALFPGWRTVSAFVKYGGQEQFRLLSQTPNGALVFMVGRQKSALSCFDVANQNMYDIYDFGHALANVWVVNDPITGASQKGNESILLLVSFLEAKIIHLACLCQNESGEMKYDYGYSSEQDYRSNHVVTSVAMSNHDERSLIGVGHRFGRIDIFVVPKNKYQALVLRLAGRIEKAHGNDAVTALMWLEPTSSSQSKHYLVSAGRDGHVSIHQTQGNSDLCHNLVHRVALPDLPSLEGLFLSPEMSTLMVYGFQSTKFIVYDVSTFQQIISVDCSAHRTWCFRPFDSQGGSSPFPLGSFAWLQSSKLHIAYDLKRNHRVVQQGSHGREIKAITTTRLTSAPSEQDMVDILITGAEDTSIRIHTTSTSNDGIDESLRCVAVLKRHTTGIQQLSCHNEYLFSSASLEEFYVWKLGFVPGIGVVAQFDSSCPWRSNDGDARLTSFSIRPCDTVDDDDNLITRFIISSAYSNSLIKVCLAFLVRNIL
jgi:WD repeat-containing protein 6